MRAIRTALRAWLQHRGYELRRNPTANPLVLEKKLLTGAAPVIFDVGAHIGLTCEQYRREFPDARIHAFEPFADSFARLQARVGADPLTHLYPLALAAQAGESTLHINTSHATNSLLPVSAQAGETWGTGLLDTERTHVIQTQTLDAFCAEHGIGKVDLLKLDVQGTEFEVLQGARELLTRQAIGLVFTEIIAAPTYEGQHALHDYLALMGGHGYTLLDWYNPIRRNGRLLQADLMFASPAVMAHSFFTASAGRARAA